MPAIQELPSHLADLIAAGEVVERPASVAKELIENAIDAGATRIQVEIENGGITYLRIMDNGSGMAAKDAPLAFRRHATSKLRTKSDLSMIGTLGFRGEALAAIAAVSRIDLFTKQKGALAGQHLHLEAGEIQTNEEAGCPEGTTIVVRDIFFNMPARMKFLKKDFTEAGYILSVVQNAALSHPEIAFVMIRSGKQVFSTSGDGKLLTPVHGVFGREITANMIEVEAFTRDTSTAWGYLTKPHLCRPNRSMQYFFVNGRPIKSRLLQAALEEAFRNKMITGKYPSCAIFISLPLHLVDVNVHPAKIEVKFAQEKNIFETVYIACKNALEKNDNIPLVKLKDTRIPALREDNMTQKQQQITMSKQQTQAVSETKTSKLPNHAEPCHTKRLTLQAAGFAQRMKAPVVDFDDSTDDLFLASPELPPLGMPAGLIGVQKIPQNFPSQVDFAPQKESQDTSTDVSEKETPFALSPRVIGEAFQTYIVAEDAMGIIFVDKHAAHERILFNELKASTNIVQQQLLTPYIAEFMAGELAVLQENIELVKSAGFDLEPFGQNSFAVRAMPAYLDAADVQMVLVEMADKLQANRAPAPNRFDDLIHTVACKAAIKAGKTTSFAELQAFCDRVLRDPEADSCPHGRPITVRLTKYEIDKLFKRVNQ